MATEEQSHPPHKVVFTGQSVTLKRSNKIEFFHLKNKQGDHVSLATTEPCLFCWTTDERHSKDVYKMALGKLLSFFQKHPIYMKESYLELENYAPLRRGEIKHSMLWGDEGKVISFYENPNPLSSTTGKKILINTISGNQDRQIGGSIAEH